MIAQEHFIKDLQRITGLLNCFPERSALDALSNTDKARYRRKLLDAANDYYSNLRMMDLLATKANLDITMAILQRLDQATPSDARIGYPKYYPDYNRRALQTSAVMAIERAVDTIPFDQARRLITWIEQDTRRLALDEKVELPSLMDRFIERCVKEEDLVHLSAFLELSEEISRETKPLNGSRTSMFPRHFVRPASQETVAATLEYLNKRPLSALDVETMERLVDWVGQVAHHGGYREEPKIEQELIKLKGRCEDFRRQPALAALEAAAATLPNTAEPRSPKAPKKRHRSRKDSDSTPD